MSALPRPKVEHCTQEPITDRGVPQRPRPEPRPEPPLGLPELRRFRPPAHWAWRSAHLGGVHSAGSAPPPRRADTPGSPGNARKNTGVGRRLSAPGLGTH